MSASLRGNVVPPFVPSGQGYPDDYTNALDGDADLIMGEARFTEPKTVQVTLNAGGTRLFRGERVFINVGTRASIPDVPGLVIAGPMTRLSGWKSTSRLLRRQYLF